MPITQQTARSYYRLTKPGIVYGNAFTAIAGYLLATAPFHVLNFLGTIVGICLVIACGCVCNNVLDRRIDKQMARTQTRALVVGSISPGSALAYAALLGVVGFVILALASNLLTVMLGLIALIFYVLIYGWAKRYSSYGTAVGSISGALPPVAGYTAARGGIDMGAVILFVLLVIWQMPHFYAIAIYRRDEYKRAGIPLLSVRKGLEVTRERIITYIALFLLAVPLLTLFGYAGITYLFIAYALGIGWLVLALSQQGKADVIGWSRRMFRYSLLIIMLMPLTLIVARFLP